VELLNLDDYKAEIHRTLISKLDLEKLSRVNSSQARQAVSGLVKEIMSDQRVPAELRRAGEDHADLLDEVFRFRAAGAAAARSKIFRHPGQRQRPRVCGKRRPATEGEHLLPRRPASDADHRSHCFQGGPQSGRVISHGGTPACRRIACQCIIPPLALDGPSMSIRRFGTGPLRRINCAVEEHFAGDDGRLSSAVRARISILVSVVRAPAKPRS